MAQQLNNNDKLNKWFLFFFFFKKIIFIYLAAMGLNCSSWDLQSLLWHEESFFVCVCGMLS